MTPRARKRRWALIEEDPAACRAIGAGLGLEPAICRILANRGIRTPEAASAYLNPKLADLPNPFDIPSMSLAAGRVALARDRKEKVAVYGDYDVDGLTSTAALRRFLEECSIPAVAHVPERSSSIRGLDPAQLEVMKSAGVGLVVTVDTGSNCVHAAGRAAELGLDLVITDHHKPSGEKPKALAVVNPQYMRQDSPMRDLSGAGVAFMLMMASRRAIFGQGSMGQPNLKRHLGLVALGTVADCTPVTGGNRILVRHGLDELSSAILSPGLAALKSVSGLNGRQIGSSSISFDLAPRLASASRLLNARVALDLLLEEDPAEAAKLASRLDGMNDSRRKIQDRLWLELRDLAANLPEEERSVALVMGGDGWEQGVIGIVASKLVDEFHAPAVIVSFTGEMGKGSCRSINGLDIHDALTEVSGYMEKFGGHSGAAGLYLDRARFGDFKNMFLRAVGARMADMTGGPRIDVDMELDPSLATLDLARRLSILEPFGEGSPAPVFMARDLEITKAPDYLGEGGQTLRLSLRSPGGAFKGIGFKMAPAFEGIGWKGRRVDILYTPEVNYWAGAERLQLRLMDIRLSDD